MEIYKINLKLLEIFQGLDYYMIWLLTQITIVLNYLLHGGK